MVKDTHIDGSLIKEQMMLLGLNLLIKIETTTLLKPDTYICGWKSWLLLLDGWEKEFSAGYLSLVLCNQWFVHCLILIFIRVSLGVFFNENHSPPPIEENQVKGQISQGTSSALLLALVLLLSAVSVLLLTSWRPPWTLACPAQCCSSLRIRAW